VGLAATSEKWKIAKEKGERER